MRSSTSPESTPARRGRSIVLGLHRYHDVIVPAARPEPEGQLAEVVGLVLEARGIHGSLGDRFALVKPNALDPRREDEVPAEVVGIRGERTLLMPLGSTDGLSVGARVRRAGSASMVEVGDSFLGRIIDGLGRPLDGGPPPLGTALRPLVAPPPNPLQRAPIEKALTMGVRAVDSLLTVAKGQRLGIFAGGGVGKSTLLGMMVRRANVDVAVVGLIGERGREVEEFVRLTLGKEGLKRSVVVAATSSDPPLLRARGALYATAIAEHFRDQGLDVLLVMDSVTRYAMALREVGLATGEPPTTKGYTPSVFAALPQLLERAGTSDGKGSITGLYTVLVEGDDLSDPVSDAARAILDGHIVLSRKLAERGHFPAIDVPQSISRVMPMVVDKDRMRRARKVRELLSSFREAEDLLAIGAYRQGALPKLDEALMRMPKLESFLQQDLEDGPGALPVDKQLDDVLTR